MDNRHCKFLYLYQYFVEILTEKQEQNWEHFSQQLNF